MPTPKKPILKKAAEQIKSFKKGVSDSVKGMQDRRTSSNPRAAINALDRSASKETRLEKRVNMAQSMSNRQANKREFFRAEKKRNIINRDKSDASPYFRSGNVENNYAKKDLNSFREKAANKRSQMSSERAKKNEGKMMAQKAKTQEIAAKVEKHGVERKNPLMKKIGEDYKKGRNEKTPVPGKGTLTSYKRAVLKNNNKK